MPNRNVGNNQNNQQPDEKLDVPAEAPDLEREPNQVWGDEGPPPDEGPVLRRQRGVIANPGNHDDIIVPPPPPMVRAEHPPWVDEEPPRNNANNAAIENQPQDEVDAKPEDEEPLVLHRAEPPRHDNLEKPAPQKPAPVQNPAEINQNQNADNLNKDVPAEGRNLRFFDVGREEDDVRRQDNVEKPAPAPRINRGDQKH
jgi:hypothetical protein